MQRLQDFIEGFLDEVKESIWELPDPDAPGYYCAWINVDELPTYPVAPMIGDALQCLRTSLDQLVFELATANAGPLPDRIAEQCEFPVFGDRWKGKERKGAWLWRERAPGKIGPLDGAAQKVIQSKQPYKAGAAFETEPLWVLHELNRVEKHRSLHFAVMTFEGVMVPPRNRWRNVRSIGPIWAGRQRIEGRTLIARYEAAPHIPYNPVRVGIWPDDLGVVFEDSVPLVAGESVLKTLWGLYNHVATEVVLPLRAFLP